MLLMRGWIPFLGLFLQELLNVCRRNSMGCLRYGLMEFGGFVRNQTLTRDQRSHMLVQERGNFVVWNLRYRADSTAHQQMQMTTTRGLRAFPLVVPQKPCWKTCVWIRTTLWMVKGERWSESSQIQQAISTLLDACDVRCQSRRTFNNSPSAPHQHSKCFSERLSRYHRGRRLDERAERFRTYVEDMQSLMR